PFAAFPEAAPRPERSADPHREGRSGHMTHPSKASEPRLVLPRRAMRAVRWLASALLISLPLAQVQAAVPVLGRPAGFESHPRTFTTRSQPVEAGAGQGYVGTAG